MALLVSDYKYVADIDPPSNANQFQNHILGAQASAGQRGDDKPASRLHVLPTEQVKDFWGNIYDVQPVEIMDKDDPTKVLYTVKVDADQEEFTVRDANDNVVAEANEDGVVSTPLGDENVSVHISGATDITLKGPDGNFDMQVSLLKEPYEGMDRDISVDQRQVNRVSISALGSYAPVYGSVYFHVQGHEDRIDLFAATQSSVQDNDSGVVFPKTTVIGEKETVGVMGRGELSADLKFDFSDTGVIARVITSAPFDKGLPGYIYRPEK